MYITSDPGLNKNSEMFFASTTPMGRELFYYPTCAGHYYCNEHYNVERTRHYTILIMQIINGKCLVETNSTVRVAEKGDMVVIDCWLPHKYQAVGSDLETVWVHVNGGNCRELCREIVKQNTNVFHHTQQQDLAEMMFKIFHILASEETHPESELSSMIYSLLCNCFNPQYDTSLEHAGHMDDIISHKAKEYIYSHLNHKISVRDLAEKVVHLSVSQFTRIFKEQTGFSPYDFVLIARLNKAKELLIKTDLSITEISEKTGFSRDSNFTTFFSTNTGISPRKFRNTYKGNPYAAQENQFKTQLKSIFSKK